MAEVGGDAYHSHDKSADEIETGFLASLAGDLVLSYSIVSRYFGNRAEEQVCAIW